MFIEEKDSDNSDMLQESVEEEDEETNVKDKMMFDM